MLPTVKIIYPPEGKSPGFKYPTRVFIDGHEVKGLQAVHVSLDMERVFKVDLSLVCHVAIEHAQQDGTDVK